MASETVRALFYVFNVFFQNPQNMTFTGFFWVVAHVFSNSATDRFTYLTQTIGNQSVSVSESDRELL